MLKAIANGYPPLCGVDALLTGIVVDYAKRNDQMADERRNTFRRTSCCEGLREGCDQELSSRVHSRNRLVFCAAYLTRHDSIQIREGRQGSFDERVGQPVLTAHGYECAGSICSASSRHCSE